jgi:hypothetical protein
MDFEEAARLRDQISLLQHSPNPTWEPPDTSRLKRQQPGAMGLGTSDPAFTPPDGWTPPRRPSPLTTGHKVPKRRR